MCGICGIADLKTRKRIDWDVARRMVQTLAHRGPDDEGLFFNDEASVFLGHRRLSIIDLAGGRQPMANGAQSVWIVFNGEIYNYRELRHELETLGYDFATQSDTESIIHLYEESGTTRFAELNGIFAFALYDAHRREVILARDHFGVKPLYYTLRGGRLVFGSEIKAILADPEFTPEIDMEALHTFLTLRYNPSPQTLIKGICKLAPGHLLRVGERGEPRVEKYWDWRPRTNRRIKERDAIEEYQRLLERAVARQMVADVPVGLLLSGGIDSAVIGMLMRQATGQRVKSFTIGFSGRGSFNELDDARASAALIGSEHHEMVLSKEDYLGFFIESFHYTEEPIAEATIPALYHVSRLAASQLKVVLAGQGADEPLAGYHRYIGERWLGRVAPLLNTRLARALTGLLPRNERLKRAVYASQFGGELERFLGIYTIFTARQKRELVRPEVYMKMLDSDQDLIDRFEDEIGGLDDSLARLMYIDTRLSLSDNLLLFGDKMTMANSLECRVPFLDLDLVEFLETLPSHLKLRGWTRKYIHKRSLEKWLPRQIIHRTKRGFETPVDAWLQTPEFAQSAKRLLTEKRAACRQYFNPRAIEEMIDRHQRRRENYLRHIFALLSFELWHRGFLERQEVDRDLLTRASAG